MSDQTPPATLFADYTVPKGTLDESFSDYAGAYGEYAAIRRVFEELSAGAFGRLNESAKLSFLNQGITYAVYSEQGGGREKIFPFDLFPRIIARAEWEQLERGLKQRNTALNLFIRDVYGARNILREKRVPEQLVKSSAHYVPAMREIRPRAKVYTHICGTDLVRHTDGKFYVLEDNLRSPSGVSYVLGNREALRRTLYGMFRHVPVQAVNEYPAMLLRTLQSVAPPGRSGSASDDGPRCVVLTPGPFNSAYYEHSLLARTMDCELVEGPDLYVDDDTVYLRTINGPRRVDVIYRRIDDAYLDPEVFKPDSQLGVAGLMRAYARGRVTIVNAPGTGIADDKAICAYVPEMIRYYLDEEPLIDNVPTHICSKEEDLQYTLEHLAELVVKPVDMSGGYGVMIGDRLTKEELTELGEKVKANPRNFIAQPKIMLSTHPTYIEERGGFAPRHIDLRTFTLLGAEGPEVLPGGLTRVALREGSLIVNSSQGGGSKDTWVISE